MVRTSGFSCDSSPSCSSTSAMATGTLMAFDGRFSPSALGFRPAFLGLRSSSGNASFSRSLATLGDSFFTDGSLPSRS